MCRKFNRRIDQMVLDLSQKPPSDPALQPLYREAGARLAQLQQHNREHQWLLKAILLGGLLHVGVCYSLYIHFLRMGFTWTKICLHANNVFIEPPVAVPCRPRVDAGLHHRDPGLQALLRRFHVLQTLR
jgi:hypothetical protein